MTDQRSDRNALTAKQFGFAYHHQVANVIAPAGIPVTYAVATEVSQDWQTGRRCLDMNEDDTK